MALDLPCDWKSGFAMDPTKKQRVGYLVAFEGLNMGDYLHKDVDVFTPFNHSDNPSYAEMTLDRRQVFQKSFQIFKQAQKMLG